MSFTIRFVPYYIYFLLLILYFILKNLGRFEVLSWICEDIWLYRIDSHCFYNRKKLPRAKSEHPASAKVGWAWWTRRGGPELCWYVRCRGDGRLERRIFISLLLRVIVAAVARYWCREKMIYCYSRWISCASINTIALNGSEFSHRVWISFFIFYSLALFLRNFFGITLHSTHVYVYKFTKEHKKEKQLKNNSWSDQWVVLM